MIHFSNKQGLSFVERLSLLVEHETMMREQRRQERFSRQARFRLSALVAEIDYQHPRNIKQSQIAQLAQSDWINRAQNLLITGPCGSSKTCLACALGHNGCMLDYNVRYFRLSRLLLELTQAKADGTYKVGSFQLLVTLIFHLKASHYASCVMW